MSVQLKSLDNPKICERSEQTRARGPTSRGSGSMELADFASKDISTFRWGFPNFPMGGGVR